jgi:outer membrane receptor protein involved in Fe transport
MNASRFRLSKRSVACLVIALLTVTSAFADVYGRLKITVKNADDEKGIVKATVVLEDSANVHPKITLTTGADGSVTTDLLEARSWHITSSATDYQDDKRDAVVARDTTTEVEVLLEPIKEKTIVIKGQKNVVKTGDSSQTTTRDQAFNKLFPATGGNPQSLQKELVSAPGMVLDSNNQVHPGGEHSGTTLYFNGVQIPGAFQGKFGQLLSPTALQSIDVQTGGFAPEYGSEAAAILNVNLRSGTLTPFLNYEAQAGTFRSAFGDLTFGGQVGQEYGQPLDNGIRARRLGYFVDLTARTTANATEPPQPQIQTDHNLGDSYTGLANFDYHASDKDTLSFFIADDPANNQIVNRAGLPSSYSAFGQGFGFNGWRNANGAVSASQVRNPGGLGSAVDNLDAQNAVAQDDNQTDHNEFGVLTWRRNVSDQWTSLLSFALMHAGIDTTNNNPLIPSLEYGLLPVDNSIEYNPTIHRNSHDAEVTGSMTSSQRSHTFKTGFVFDQQNGEESYQLIPGSQLALDWLANPGVGQPSLLPSGTYAVDASGNPVLDVYGNQVYEANAGATSPILYVRRAGHYAAGYAQDTWKITKKLTLNYGFRLDNYDQTQTSTLSGQAASQSSVNQTFLSPRVNAAYAFDSKTVIRADFDRLVTQPPLAEGQLLGTQIKPETWSQFDAAIEHQVGPGQSVRVAAYKKLITNQIDTSLLIGQTQMGAYTSVNFQRGHTDGIEFTYNLAPEAVKGLAAYITYTNSLAKPSGPVNGNEALYGDAPTYNDHDQLNTLSTGANYTFLRTGTSLGADFYFGSGVESSRLSGDLPRQSRYYLNLSLVQPHILPHIDLELLVENITDNRSVINFQSGFSGTRFQQGRAFEVALKGTF